MALCKGQNCNNTLGNNNKSGHCRLCAQKNRTQPSKKTIQDLNDGNVSTVDEIPADIMNSKASDLTISGFIHLIKVINEPIQAKLDSLQDDLQSIRTRVNSLEEKSESVQGSLLTKTTEIAELKSKLPENGGNGNQQILDIQKIVDNHQRYLEKADSYRRENNVVVFGLQESQEENDSDKVKEILQSIGCQNVEPEKVKRLGKVAEETASVPTTEPVAEQSTSTEGAHSENNPQRRRPRHRPILVTLKSQTDRSDIIKNTHKLKRIESLKTVFIKKDQTPAERKEWARLRTVLTREKDRPENQGFTVKIDYRTRCVKVGDRVIEKGNFRYGPEM